MRAFREALDDCSLLDLGWSGVEHTWDNGKSGELNVKARLDRGVGNLHLTQLFPHTLVRHISTMESDHCFTLVDLRQSVVEPREGRTRQFRCEDIWQTHSEYDSLVLREWHKGAGLNGLQGIMNALNSMQSTLATWGAKEFGCLTRRVRKLRDKLDRLRRRPSRRA